MKLIFTILFLFSTNSIFSIDKITKQNLLSNSQNQPLLIITALGCGPGLGYVNSVNSYLEDLEGVKVGWADINEAYSFLSYSKSIEMGDIVLVSNGKVIDSSTGTDPDKSIIAGNLARKWVNSALKKNNIKFKMGEVEPDFLEPIADSSTPNLDNGIMAHFELSSNFNNKVNENRIGFESGKKNRFINQAYYSDGTYGYDKNHKMDNLGDVNFSEKPKDSYSVAINIKPETRTDNRNQILFTVGYRMIVFYRNPKSGTLFVESSSSCENCSKTKESLWLQGKYSYNDVKIDFDKWNNFVVSVDFKNNRAAILHNGKRLKDINLGKDFFRVFNQKSSYDYFRRTAMSLDMFGSGSVFKGYVRDMILYNRLLTGKELVALEQKYSLNKSNIPITDPTENKNLAALNKDLIKSAKNGDVSGIANALKSGADVNAKIKGWTALIFASYFGKEDAVKELIKNNANPSIEVDGWNAQRFAKKFNFTSIDALLEEYSNKPENFAQRKFVLKNSRSSLTPPNLE
ncbi:MAG: ankyrin repeat domain-containing protein [Leptospiraceae bacterium]|nr:ankyrin repeat domain-containing protein [Leptospiraceae bacterium]